MIRQRFSLALLLVSVFGCSREYDLPYKSQIEESLAPFKAIKVSREMMLEVYEASPDTRAYIEIFGGKLGRMRANLSKHFIRAEHVRRMLDQVNSDFGPLPNMVLVFNLADGLEMPLCKTEPCALAPIFSFQAAKTHADIPFPYLPFLDIDAEYKAMHRQAFCWESKINGLVWRGSQTGGLYDEKNWKTFPRSQLILKCKALGERCDAGFSSFTQTTEGGQNAILSEVGLRTPIPLEEMQRWKYIASLDGNGWADRFVKLLASNSAIFKQESPYYEFFYAPLKPYEHYIPVARDMSDLEQQLEWAENNPEHVKSIIKNANDFSRTHLRQDQVNYYVYKLLLAYSQLME